MPDSTNDIDALLRYLDNGHWPQKHAALTALVAERDALREQLRLCSINAVADAGLPALITQRDALKARVAELESRNSVSVQLLLAERDGLREQLRLANIDQFNTEAESNDRDRDLRDRDDALTRWMDQVTMMLCHSMTHSHDAKQELVTRCDAAIAAMQKGEADGQ